MELSRKSDKYTASLITLVIHGLLLLLFLLYKIVTPIPPFEIIEPGGGGGLGVELNFGDSPDGMGNTNPELLTSTSTGATSPMVDDEVMASDIEDTYIPEVKRPKTPKPKKPIKELKRVQEGPTITQHTAPEEVTDQRAMYPGKKGGSEGKTGKAGNQGEKGGDPYADLYQGKGGKGPGKGGNGSGGGDGDGDGPGKGSGTGPGISANLLNRKATSLPKPAYTSEKSGKVVVDITVDQNGNVIKAIAGSRGTTVQDAELFRQAESAAKRAKFNPDNSSPEKQIGTITYNFIRR
jgi:TonB family protein